MGDNHFQWKLKLPKQLPHNHSIFFLLIMLNRNGNLLQFLTAADITLDRPIMQCPAMWTIIFLHGMFRLFHLSYALADQSDPDLRSRGISHRTSFKAKKRAFHSDQTGSSVPKQPPSNIRPNR